MTAAKRQELTALWNKSCNAWEKWLWYSDTDALDRWFEYCERLMKIIPPAA